VDDTTAGPPTNGRHDGDRPLRLQVAAVSDVGRHRKENQDSGYASGNLLVIADGVGGAAYGDVASATAVHLLRRLDQLPASPSGDEMLTALAGAVHRVHDKLAEMVEQDHELDGTSTTVTAALFDGHALGFAHVGDSRAYLLRQGRVEQITHDHTFVQTLIDEGRITEDEARVHPHRNIILRAVDGVRDAEPDLFQVALEPGDRVMLCSDGCSGVLDDEAIAGLLGTGPVEAAARDLVHAALDNGTTDNVTVVVAEVAPSVESPTEAVHPAIVGAAAAQPRRGGMLGRALFRRQSDTGELEAVDAEPLDPEELRYLPRPPRRHAGVRRALLVLVPLLLVVGALVGAYTWTQNQYYVADDGGFVAIYQGVQLDLPGIDLSSVHETDTLKLADLPEFNQEQVRDGIVASSYSDAQRIVQNLRDQLQEKCDAARAAQEAERKRQQQAKKDSRNNKKQSARDGAAAAGTTTELPSGCEDLP
jgi:serine/threonine protein phosphatase PrpC